MSHTHQHHHSHTSGITFAFWLNLIFSAIEFIGGIATNSTAIMTDALHDFTDALAIGLTALLEKLSGKKRTSTFSYGYKRFSLLSALGMSAFLLVGAVFMCVSGFKSFIHPQEVNSTGMLWLAALGIGINGIALIRMKKSNEHSHQNGHTHSHTSKAIMLHLLEDVLGWIAVLIGAIIMYVTGWYWIDGLLALAIALFIGVNAVRNFISTMAVLLQSVPENVNIEHLATELTKIPGVKNIHDLHVWSIDGAYHIGSLHAVVNTLDHHKEPDILSAILQLMYQHNIQHPTVQIETASKNCSLNTC